MGRSAQEGCQHAPFKCPVPRKYGDVDSGRKTILGNLNPLIGFGCWGGGKDVRTSVGSGIKPEV